MNVAEVRKKYLEFFSSKGGSSSGGEGHKIIPSASLVPENDPTTLFTGSGMQPLIPYLLGQKHPMGIRLTNSQKCFRAEDIDEIGDNRHTTFFEMLGNWSLGDYFKVEQLPWFFEFLTDEIKIAPSRLYVTVFAGDPKNNIPKDEEAVAIWKKLFSQKGIEAQDVKLITEEQGGELGMQDGRIFYYGAKKNWWSRSGVPENMPAGEPGGPDSEVFYEFTEVEHNPKFGKHCHPNCDCGRFLEIGNSVFMEYKKNEDGSFEKLKQRNVDFGGGLERIVMAATNSPDIVAVNHRPILDYLEKESNKVYGLDASKTEAFRIIADHMKAAVFLISDGVLPTNADQGYFTRRLIRRSVRYADLLGISESTFASVVRPIAEMYKDAYPDIGEKVVEIERVVGEEEGRFRETLTRGLKEFERLSGGDISGHDAFVLFSTYGFPLELTVEIAKEKGIEVDVESYKEEFKKHQEISRAGSEKKFKGGLADTKEETVRLHTAHHLLLAALQKVLGENVKQRGSNITAERLRIDFSYPEKMTKEQIAEVQSMVNKKIKKSLKMVRREMSKEEALKIGAEMEFGAKYGDIVSVYFVEEKDGTPFSKEFCGGPHVNNTGELGNFKIIKEEAVSVGVRRIKAILE